MAALRSVYGARLEYEPQSYAAYSDTRPDLSIDGAGAGGGKYLGDTKLWDSVGSDPAKTAARGGFVGFGNTLPDAEDKVHGRPERGEAGRQAGPLRIPPSTGCGWPRLG